MKKQGYKEDKLQLLRDVSGAFKPGVFTALVGVSGAGKTTLLDVLAGRKTVGYIEGCINISGYPKNQATFARISTYCEQIDTHSPYVTVYESLLYSAFLRLSSNVDPNTQKMFVEEVMELVELGPIKDSLVGLPSVNGLSTEQRKRLTIAVELVANPSIIFMDEPTSGLDARAAAIVMRVVKNTVNSGRTLVCTIHQPSIDIFEAFDELILMKRGGQVIYAGPLGQHSRQLIEYFEAIPGVPKIKDGYNPATWMVEISTLQAESQLDLDFARHYTNSPRYETKEQDLMDLLGALYLAVLFLGSINTYTVQVVVDIERTVFYREKAAGMYSTLPYAFAQVTVETIYNVIQTLLYTVILYFMIGLEWDAQKFFYFYYIMLSCFLYFTTFGMMLVSLTPNHQISSIFMNFFLNFWNLFAGFLIPRPQMPIWWRWYYWASPISWTLYGLMTSQMGDMESLIVIPGVVNTNMTIKDFLQQSFGYDYKFLPIIVVAHLGWALLFFIVYVLGIRFLNYQQR